jgi:hypothetical protein
MLIPVHRLVDRLLHPRSRADELGRLRQRLATVPRDTGEEERALAAEMRALREEIARMLAGVTSCSSCARGHPLPHGRFDGGHCCGAPTFELFTDDEIAALALGGTRASDMRAPTGDHAGCAFRGETGCTLDPRDRPSLCVRFVCRRLEAELRARGDWMPIRAVGNRLGATFARFTALRDTRRAEQSCEAAM